MLRRHEMTCMKNRDRFNASHMKAPDTIFEKLDSIGVDSDTFPKTDTTHIIAYDFEAALIPHTQKFGQRSCTTARHVPISFAISCDLPGYEEGMVFFA